MFYELLFSDILLSCIEPVPSLFIEFQGERYPFGSVIPITAIGESISQSNPGNSLVCVTSEVRTSCCRLSDGGSVGEWYFPNGTQVPRNKNSPNGDYSRRGYAQQARLNRRNNAMGPVGTYTCRVPDENLQVYTANIMLGKYASQNLFLMYART